MTQPEKYHETLFETTDKRKMKTNLNNINQNKGTIDSPTVIADTFNKKIVKFATTFEGPSTQELNEFIENIDNFDYKLFDYPTNKTDVSKIVVNLKNIEASVSDGISVEVRIVSLPGIGFIFTDFTNLSMSLN